MKILIKLFDESKSNFNDYDFVISTNKHDKNNDFKKWSYIPYDLNESISLNRAFWIINNKIDSKEFKEEVTVINIDFSTSTILNRPTINSLDKNDVDIYYCERSDILTINNINLIRHPLVVRYKMLNGYDYDHYFCDYINLWIAFLSYMEIEFQTNIINEHNSYLLNIEKSIYELIKKNKKRLDKLRENDKFKKCEIVNFGNEGIIYKLDKGKLLKSIYKPRKKINEEIQNMLNQHIKSSIKGCFAENEMIEFNKEIDLRIDHSVGKNVISYSYKNIILPKMGFKFGELASLLIRQLNFKNLAIIDTKTENFGRILIPNSEFSKIIYCDFGKSFIKIDDEKEWKKYFDGVVRDYFLFTKFYKNHSYRYIIKEKRNFIKNRSEFGGKLKLFADFVYSYKNDYVFLCHDKLNLSLNIEEFKKSIENKEIRLCKNHISNIYLIKKEVDKKIQVYDYNRETLGICSCENSWKIIDKYNLKFKEEKKVLDNKLNYIEGYDIYEF